MSDSPTLFADEQDLLDELRAMAPRPSAQFAAELDARVAGRFGEPERPAAAPRKRRRFSLPLLTGSLASAAVAAVVVVVILSGGRSGTDTLSSTSSSGVATVASEVAPPASADASRGASTTASPASPPAAAGGQPRRVERQAQLTVAIAAGRFDAAAAQVPQIAAAANAIVDTSRVSTDSMGGRANYTLRVPAARLNDTLAQLSKLGRVTARDETGYDITGAVVSTEDRLGDLRAERDSVRRQLAAETDPDKAAELGDRLNALRREVARVRGEAIRLQQRTSYATVSLTLDERRAGDSGSGSDDDKGGIAGALDDAGNILGGMAAVGIVALAVALPIALLVVLLWKGAALLRRRRREAGLV
jgi:hypothetical protein